MSAEIHASIQAKDVERLRRAIAACADVHTRARPLQVTPLHVAARYGAIDCMMLLLDSGAAVDAQGQYGSTPLYDACDYKQATAARVLLARGVNANANGDRGRTPLHVAIKRGLVGIVHEMLDAGVADPSIPSRGGDHATTSYIKRSSSSSSKRHKLLELLPKYVSLESAVASRNPVIIEAIVKRAFATNDVGVAIATYLSAVPHHTGLDAYRVRLLMATIQVNRPDIFQRVLYTGVGDATATQPIGELLDRTRFEGDQEQTTALHIAAFYGHTDFITFLVEDCDMDPEVVDALTRRPIQLVTDASDPTGRVRTLLTQLTQQRRFRRFTELLLSCSLLESTTLDTNPELLFLQLESLTETLSSVRDVRVVLHLGVATLSQTPELFKKLLTQAFTRLIQDKLVINDREAVLFQMVIRECETRSLFSASEVEYWALQLVKVSMESAPWVTTMQRSLTQIDWRVHGVELHTKTLRRQYDHLTQMIHQAKASGAFSAAVGQLRHLLSLFAVVLSLAGVDGASDVIDAVVDLSDHALAITYDTTDTEQVRLYLDDPDPHLLREAILLERKYHDENTGGRKSAGIEPEEKKTETKLEPKNDLEQFPFHYAVAHSGGDLQAFLNVIEFIEEKDLATQGVLAVPQTCSRYSRVKTVRGTPAIVASHFGYVAITKYLLDHDEVSMAKTEKPMFGALATPSSALSHIGLLWDPSRGFISELAPSSTSGFYYQLLPHYPTNKICSVSDDIMYWYMMLLTPAAMLPAVSATNDVAATLIAGAAHAVETIVAATPAAQATAQEPALAPTEATVQVATQVTALAPVQTGAELHAHTACSTTTDAVEAEAQPEPKPTYARALPQELLELELSLADPLLVAALETLTAARHAALGRMPVPSDTVLRIVGGLYARNGGRAFALEAPLGIVDVVLDALWRHRFDVAAAYADLTRDWLQRYRKARLQQLLGQQTDDFEQHQRAAIRLKLKYADLRECQKRLQERTRQRRENDARLQ